MPPQSVEIHVAEEVATYNNIEVSSSITSLYEVVIQPRVDGFLRSINFSDGMPISRGKLLFTIESNTYNIARLAAQAELESAQAQEILARSNYERAVPLARIDAISQSDLDQYRATHSAAIAAVKSAREALNNAELNLSYTRIYAPIDGVIAATSANEGDYVGPSTAISTLTTISYLDTVEVYIPIPTSIYLESVTTTKSGYYDNATLLSDIELTLSGAERYPYKGLYNYTKKDTPTTSSTIVIVAKFPNPELRLKSGMFARIRANIGAQRERVVVPQIAVSQSQGVNSVWIMKPDSTVEFRKVTLGGTTREGWIIDSGIERGESVLLSGQMKVHNGAKVSPKRI